MIRPSTAALVVAQVALAGCGRTGSLDAARAAEVFDRIPLETAGVNGLSGLAVDGDGAVWTVAERGQMIFRVELVGAAVRDLRRFTVDLPDGRDLEALAWADGQLWAGLETRGSSSVAVVALERAGDGYVARDAATITAAEVGLPIGDNHGVEGLCAAAGVVVAAVEVAGTDEHGRWAPLVVLDRAALADPSRRHVRRLRLTSATGKISGLDCRAGAGGTIEVIAVERHFEITRLLSFSLDPAGTSPITPRLAYDLAPVLRGSLNLEGLAWLPDGRVLAVVDNQYGKITGPNELLRFKSPALLAP